MQAMPEVSLADRKRSKPPRFLTLPIPDDVLIEDHESGENGLPQAIRVYRSAGQTAAAPIVAFAHGGGFASGGLDSMQFLCAHIASGAEVVVVSIDYPLAPEHPYPAALDAVYATTDWLSRHGDRIGGDVSHLAVMGDSAGANLAAAACLLARTNGYPVIERQVLIYPTLDATLTSPRMSQTTDTLRRRDCDLFYGYYAGAANRGDELISPLLSRDLRGLPPALIIAADHDIFRDDGLLYAERLRAAAVPVRLTNYLGMPHGFLSMPRLCAAAPQAISEIVQELSTVRC